MTEKSMHVICVCCGTGFPGGLAQASRMRLVGQAVIEGGGKFSLFHIGGSEFENPGPEGCADRIRYKYFPGATRRPSNPLIRQAVYFWGALKMLAAFTGIKKSAEKPVVYLWVKYGLLGRLLLNGFRLLKIPVVLEFNEWWPGSRSDAERRFAHRMSAGSIPISSEIEKRLTSWAGYGEFPRKMLRLPILIDTKAWSPAAEKSSYRELYYLWCGNAAVAEADVKFMLQALFLVRKQVPDIRLVLAGRASSEIRRTVASLAASCGLPGSSVEVTGYLPTGDLKEMMYNATGLLIPLWNEERSICRFPTKLGEYLASGTPVISSKTGDVGRFVEHGRSALLSDPGDVQGFANNMIFVSADPEKAGQIGVAGRHVAEKHLDFRNYSQSLYNFFMDCAEERPQ